MQTLKDKEKIDPTMQDQVATCVNVSGTDSAIDTPLTQPRSGFDLEDTRRQLIAQRSKLGADTPAGHRISNILELLQAPVADPVNRRTRDALIERQMAELAAYQSQ
jgi:hypothetical protein